MTYKEFTSMYSMEMLTAAGGINNQVNIIFFNYRIEEIELLSKGLSETEVISKIGRKPWVVLREIIEIAKLPFRINDPSELGFRDDFELVLTHTHTNQNIKFADLSSGEKILLSLQFYMYRSEERAVFPKLLLLDEPDAHLHPSMTQQFLNVIKNVMVDKFDVQVIMTTHSPSTVVMSDEQNLFEMSIAAPRIKHVSSKEHLVDLLTAGLVYVGSNTKYYFVEDKEDEFFYTAAYRIIKDEILIEKTIPLVFIPARIKGSEGGKVNVSNWTTLLVESGITNIVNGIIDKDKDNKPQPGVKVLKRYSIENFIADPIVIYCALLDLDKAPVIPGVSFKMGDEQKIRNSGESVLQKISNSIINDFEATTDNDPVNWRDPIIVGFNTLNITYPRWMIERRGKDIISTYKTIYGPALHFNTLMKAFKRLKMIPNDLLLSYTEMQNSSD